MFKAINFAFLKFVNNLLLKLLVKKYSLKQTTFAKNSVLLGASYLVSNCPQGEGVRGIK